MNMNKQMLNSKKQPLYKYELTLEPIAKVYMHYLWYAYLFSLVW